MIKIYIHFLSVILFLSFFVLPVFAQENNQLNLSKKQQETFQRLDESASNLYIDWDDLDTVPDLIRMSNLNIKWESDDYLERSYQFLEEYKDLY